MTLVGKPGVSPTEETAEGGGVISTGLPPNEEEIYKTLEEVTILSNNFYCLHTYKIQSLCWLLGYALRLNNDHGTERETDHKSGFLTEINGKLKYLLLVRYNM